MAFVQARAGLLCFFFSRATLLLDNSPDIAQTKEAAAPPLLPTRASWACPRGRVRDNETQAPCDFAGMLILVGKQRQPAVGCCLQPLAPP